MHGTETPTAGHKVGRGSFGSRLGFILAAAGSAVGLGNLWKFPYMAYQTGGGDTDHHGAGGFVLIYLIAAFAVGLPIMVAEVLIGRRAQKSPVGAFKALRPGTPWKIVGGVGVFAGFLLLTYYNVVAGWTIEYAFKSTVNQFGTYDQSVSDDEVRERLWRDYLASPSSVADLNAAGHGAGLEIPAEGADQDEIVGFRRALRDGWDRFAATETAAFDAHRAAQSARLWAALAASPDFADRRAELKKELLPAKLFAEFIANPAKQIGFALLFMALTVAVVIGGVAKGIERAAKVLMPALFLMLLGLLVRMLWLDGASEAVRFLFRPNLSHVTAATVLAALGQAFFSLSIGMGTMITYGSYLSRRESLPRAAFAVTVMDSLIALIAAVIIFSAIFSYGLVMKDGGAGNLFTAIPVIFMKFPGGQLLCVTFYVLVVFAALTSTISLLETVVSYFIDERGWARRRATLVVSAGVFAVGVPAALSFSSLADVTFAGRTWFDLSDYVCSNWLLPLGGLFVALFAGWALTKREQIEELGGDQAGWFFPVWRVLVRVVAPAAVLAVLIGMVVGQVQGG